MLLLSSLNLLLDRRSEDSNAQGGNGTADFPSGQLSSAAWEGWWHDDAAQPSRSR